MTLIFLDRFENLILNKRAYLILTTKDVKKRVAGGLKVTEEGYMPISLSVERFEDTDKYIMKFMTTIDDDEFEYFKISFDVNLIVIINRGINTKLIKLYRILQVNLKEKRFYYN